MTTQTYIGTKIITAWPECKDGVHGYGVHGYGIKYADGYTSWSPKAAFEEAYRPFTGLTFGMALEALKKGFKVARAGWNGKGMFLFLVPGSEFKVSRPPLLGIYEEGHPVAYRPHIDLKNADGTVGTWAPSNSDALAEDWYVLED